MTVEQQTEYSMEPLADSLLTKQLIHIWQSLLAMRRERHFQTRDTCPTVFQPGYREEDRKGEGWEGDQREKRKQRQRWRRGGEEGELEKGKGTYKDMHTLLITIPTSPQPPSNTYLTDMQPTRNDPSLKDIPGKLHPL